MVRIGAIPFGFEESAVNFRRMGQDAMELGEFLNLVADDMLAVTGAVFDSEGRRGGGSWRKLTIGWLRRKERSGGDPRIGHFREDLRDSLTVRGDMHQILDINQGEATIRFGSSLPYFDTQQRHRPVIKFTARDRQRWAGWLSRDIYDRWAKRARRRT